MDINSYASVVKNGILYKLLVDGIEIHSFTNDKLADKICDEINEAYTQGYLEAYG